MRQSKPIGRLLRLNLSNRLLNLLQASPTPSAVAHQISTLTTVSRIPLEFVSLMFPNVMCLSLHSSSLSSNLIRPAVITSLSIHIGKNLPPLLLESTVCQMCSLETLEIDLSQRLYDLVPSMQLRRHQHELFLAADFSKLHALRQLHKLTICLFLPSSVNDSTQVLDKVIPPSFICLVRSLPVLQALWILDLSHYIIPWMPEIIRRVAQQPHKLQLTWFNFTGYHTLPILEALCQIPSITLFLSSNPTPDLPVERYSLLAKLPNLTDLDLSEAGSHQITAANAVVAVKFCPQVSEISLVDMRLPELQEILSLLLQLTSLKASNSPSIKSLSFVGEHGLPLRLRCLSLTKYGPIPSNEVEHLFQLQQLRFLSVSESFEDSMSEEVKNHLTFSSATCKFPYSRKGTTLLRGELWLNEIPAFWSNENFFFQAFNSSIVGLPSIMVNAEYVI